MGRAPTHDDPPDGSAAPVARFAGPLVDLEVLLHRAVAFRRGVIVDGTAAPFDRLGQHVAQADVKPADVVGSEGVSVAQRVQSGAPQRLVGIDVPHAGEEVLVHQQRLEAATAAREQGGEPLRSEVVGEWLRPCREYPGGLTFNRQAADRIAAVEAQAPELAHIAKAQLTAVRQRKYDVDVAILRRAGGHDEELTCHLEVDCQDGWLRGPGSLARRQPDEKLLPAPADSVDLASHYRGGESAGFVTAQGRWPVGAHAHDPRTRNQGPQVAGDSLDFGQLGHALEGSGAELATRARRRTGPSIAGRQFDRYYRLYEDFSRPCPGPDGIADYGGFVGFLRHARGDKSPRSEIDLIAMAREQLRRLGADPDLPHRTRHLLYLPSVNAAQQAARALGKPGRQIEIETSSRKGYWLVIVTQAIVINPEAIAEIRSEIALTIELFGGEYDGWQVATR
jgi:hypothetical protein